MAFTRRGFMMGCSTAIASMAGARFGSFAFADPLGSFNDETLVVVFLRGGMDGLNLVPPIGGADRGHYETARADLAVPISGASAALPLGTSPFGLHPSASALHDLYTNGSLAIVQAVGMDVNNRSHFDSMDFIERGTPGDKTTSTGWLTRHLSSASNLPSEIIMPALSVGNLQTTSLLGERDAVNMEDPGSFNFNSGYGQWRDAQRVAMRNLYGGTTWLHQAGLSALDAMDIIELNAPDNYTPANGASYPSGSFGDHMQVVAQMIKLNLGLRVATVDLGGWDTHNGQGNDGGGYFAGIVETLSQGLNALYTDLDGNGAQNYTSRLTTVVQSEFGRRLRQNEDDGTDHGHANMMLVMGGSVNGGLHGTWPGLSNDQLYDNADLAVTTDYRQVLSEILIRRMGNNQLGTIFPGYQDYAPINVVQGPDLTPVYGAEIFGDNFEGGDMSRWSAITGAATR
ncbi:MAG: DUF1501 domain-containing protein [Acidobacteriota bacterium]